MKRLALIFIALLSIASCAHGPQTVVCASNPPSAQFNCSDQSGATSTVSYSQAADQSYVVYPPQGAQAVLDYCEANTVQGTQPPAFLKCSTDLSNQGFDCVAQICEVNGFENGLNCTNGDRSFVPFSASMNFVAFSAADDQTIMDYCNVSFQN